MVDVKDLRRCASGGDSESDDATGDDADGDDDDGTNFGDCLNQFS